MAHLKLSARSLPREFYVDPQAFVEAELAAGRKAKKETPAQKKAVGAAVKKARATGRKKDGTPAKYPKKKKAAAKKPEVKKPIKKKAASKRALGSGLEQITKPAKAAPAKKNAVERVADGPEGWASIQRKTPAEPASSLAKVIHQANGWVAHHSGGPAAVVTKGKQVHIFHGDDADKQAAAFVDAQDKKVQAGKEKEAGRKRNPLIGDLTGRLHAMLTFRPKGGGQYKYDRDDNGKLKAGQEAHNKQLDEEFKNNSDMFFSLTGRLRKDKSFTREDAIDLAHEFNKMNYDGTVNAEARRMPKSTSKEAALRRIEHRMESLETSRAKSRATGGRSAA